MGRRVKDGKGDRSYGRIMYIFIIFVRIILWRGWKGRIKEGK